MLCRRQVNEHGLPNVYPRQDGLGALTNLLSSRSQVLFDAMEGAEGENDYFAKFERRRNGRH